MNAELKYYVDKHQLSNKTALPLFDNLSTVVTNHTAESLRICHPFDAFTQGLRGYIDTLLPALKSSMDVQTSNGRCMVLKYVSSYVSKWKEFSTPMLYIATTSPQHRQHSNI